MRILKLLLISLVLFASVLLLSHTSLAATLGLSPATGSFNIGDTITVTITLNTEGASADGVDIRYLNYDPALLEVIDEDPGTSGIQILYGSLMPNTVSSSVDTVNGRIGFSQVTSGGATFTNTSAQTLATVRFRALAQGTAAVTFSATPGTPTDTNVGVDSFDVLTSVTNGSYTLNSTKFSIGDRVITTASVNVRSCASTSCSILDTQDANALGVVVGGPTAADGYNWWQIDYDTGADGWTAEDFLASFSDTQAPTVSISSPLNNTTYTEADDILIVASASDNDQVSKVEFFRDNILVGSDTDGTDGWSTLWSFNSQDNGSYVWSARAFDRSTNSTLSNPITLTVSIDDRSPIITSGPTAENITESASSILWGTDEPATSQVNYGFSSCFDGATPLGTVLTTAHDVLLATLSSDTTYYYCARSKDASGNETISTQQSFRTLGIGDTTPPSTVTDLRTTFVGKQSVDLAWSAPGDDDSVGTAFAYDIRYLENTPVTESNWASALQATGEPTPSPSGTLESYILVDLNPGKTYYVALRAIDEAGNWSAISNQVSFTTTQKGAPRKFSLIPFLLSLIASPAFAQETPDEEFDITPPPSVGSFKAQGAGNQILLTWSNPISADYVRTLIVRKESSAPSSVADGTVLYEGRGQAVVDTNVGNGATYYYAAFTFDRAMNYSAPMTASATPVADKTSHTISDRKASPQAPTHVIASFSFARNLRQGDSGEDVRNLQRFLNGNGFAIGAIGAGSPGNETTYFGALTRAAVIRFQEAHRAEVLAPYNLSRGTGFVGASTRAKLNGLYNGTTSSPSASISADRQAQMLELQQQMAALFLQVQGLQAQLARQSPY